MNENRNIQKKKSYYYSIKDDMELFPDALFIIVYGGRGTGKTYGGLRELVETNTKFVFIKRTLEDIKLLTAGNKIGTKHEEGDAVVDLSPFKPLNRDFGWNIRAFGTYPGMGAFFKCDTKHNPVGDAVGYIAALSGIGKIKGFDMTDAKIMMFDEFCPKSYEIISKNEATEILDMYKTINRDREHRGQPPLMLWAFANSDNVVCPLIEAFDLIDVLAEMALKHKEYYYNPETRVLLHKLQTSEEFLAKEAESPIYKATATSRWTKMALDNDFAFNDFSQIGKASLKNMICEARVLYGDRWHFVYYSPDEHTRYVTYTNHNKEPRLQFDLNRNSNKKQFCTYAERKVLQIYYGVDDAKFESYSLYDLYYNARKKLG